MAVRKRKSNGRFDLTKEGKGYSANLKMNDDTYKLRREIINIIYGAKNHVDLPRVNVRITDAHKGKKKNVLGTGSMGGIPVVWIPKTTINDPRLKQVVYHELVHAVCNKGHDPRCKLMKPTIATDGLMSDNDLNDTLKKYIRGMRK